MTHIAGFERDQLLLLPEAVDDYVGSDRSGFDLLTPSSTGLTPRVSPARFARATSSAPAKRSPRHRSRRSGGRSRRDVAPRLLRRRADARVAAPDDHRRDVRERAPCAVATAEPDQDRHLMTVAAHSASQRRFSSPPAARRSMTPLTSRRHRSSFDRRAGAQTRDFAINPARPCPSRRQDYASPAIAATNASVRDPQIPIGRVPPQRPSSPRFPPSEAFERRPRASHTVAQRAGVETLHLCCLSRAALRTAGSAESGLRLKAAVAPTAPENSLPPTSALRMIHGGPLPESVLAESCKPQAVRGPNSGSRPDFHAELHSSAVGLTCRRRPAGRAGRGGRTQVGRRHAEISVRSALAPKAQRA